MVHIRLFELPCTGYNHYVMAVQAAKMFLESQVVAEANTSDTKRARDQL